MIWTILIVIIAFVLFSFFSDFNKDNADLQGKNANEKFNVIVSIINDVAYDGMGEITTIDKRAFTLYKNGEHQIISFQYGTGNLIVIWKYKYFQKEVVHEKTFYNVRNISIFDQEKMARTMIEEMKLIVEKHQRNVLMSSL
jgi:hypothetical protein